MARVRGVLRTAWCQNKTCVSFPRRFPNPSLRHLGAQDFKGRRAGCLADAAWMKQKPSLPGLGWGLHVLPALLCWGNELAVRRGVGQVFLFLGNVSPPIQPRNPCFLVFVQILNYKAASPLSGECWGQSLKKHSFVSRCCNKAPLWCWRKA